MGKNYVDQYIKEQLKEHEVSIDTDLLWAAVKPEKSKRTYLGFWSLGIGLLLILGMTVAFFLKNESTNTNLSSNQNFKYVDSNNIDNIKSTKSIEKELENTKTTTSLNASNNTSITSKNTNTSQSISSEKPMSGQSVLSNNKVNNKSKFIASKNSSSDSSSKTDFNNANTTKRNIVETTQSDNNNNTPNSMSSLFVENASTDSSQNNLTNSNFKNANNRLKTSSQKKTLTLEGLESEAVNTLIYKRKFKNPVNTDCPTFGSKKKNIYVQLYSFLDYVNSGFSAGENTDYRDARANTQSYMPSYRAGAQLKYLFNNGLYVKGGIEYGAMRERFNHRLVDTTYTIMDNQLIDIIIDNSGDTTQIFGPAPVTIIESKRWRVKNSYTSLDIPVLIGYQMNKGNWTYGIEAGVINNISFNFKGLLLDEDKQPIDAQDYFKDNIKMSLTGGLTMGYNIKPKVSLLMMGHFKRHMTTINAPINSIDQKNTSFGIGVGVEFKL